MQLRVVSIFVWRGRAYVPVQAQYESGIFTSVEPVLTVDLTLGELTSAVGAVLVAGHPHLPNPTREEAQKRNDPVLMAAKASTLKEMMSEGASYGIAWTNKEVRVDMSRLDKKGRWEFDPAKVRVFPLDTPLEEVLAVILEDIRSRPELQATEKG